MANMITTIQLQLGIRHKSVSQNAFNQVMNPNNMTPMNLMMETLLF